MVENRIISENKSNFDEKGFLNYDYLKNYFDCKRETHWGEFKGESGRYIIDETNNKLYADVEIISSQIYNKLGIKTPVPLVVAKKEDGFKRFFIVKNSLSTDDKSYLNSRFGHFSKMKNVFKEDFVDTTMLAANYHQYRSGQIVDGLLFKKSYSNDILDYFRKIRIGKIANENQNGVFSRLDPMFCKSFIGERNPILNYFYVDAVKKRMKMNLLDISIQNSTRTPADYLYKLDKNGLVVDVMSMSSGNSAFNISNLMNNNFNKMDDNYFNDFSKKRLKAVKILENYSTNLVANSFMNANERIEFGKKLKEVSEMEIAHDIEKNTNYRVNDRVYDTIMTCVYDMGQNLERNF